MSDQTQFTPEEMQEIFRQIEACRKTREKQANMVFFLLGCVITYILCHV